MKTMFKVDGYSKITITPVTVLKETACQVVYEYTDWNGRKLQRRQNKDGEFFDTWEAAHASVIARFETKLESAQRALDRARSELQNVRNLTPEKVTA